jgi:hypothetical protein
MNAILKELDGSDFSFLKEIISEFTEKRIKVIFSCESLKNHSKFASF